MMILEEVLSFGHENIQWLLVLAKNDDVIRKAQIRNVYRAKIYSKAGRIQILTKLIDEEAE